MLSHAVDNSGLDLAATVKIIQARESGKRSSSIISSSGGFNRLLATKGQKTNSLESLDKVDSRKCGWCGQVCHGGRAPTCVRREKCKSFNQTCECCSSIGHYGSQCRSKKRQKSDLSTITETQDLGNGNFCQISTFTNKRNK